LFKYDGKCHTKVQHGSFSLQKPNGKLAEIGDSGAILCYDDDNQNINVCAMLAGKLTIRDNSDNSDNSDKESLCFLPLSCGLEELNKITNGEFKLITLMENSPVQIDEVGEYLQASGLCKYLTN
jgi:hypothetical protein